MNHETIIISPFPILLKELASLNQQLSNFIAQILQIISTDLFGWKPNPHELPFIASYIHKLYVIPSSSIRASLIQICFQLELLSEDPIIELYHFDYLIVTSLNQHTLGTITRTSEKQNCFEYITLLLQSQKPLPLSIIRVLISIYNSQDSQYQSFILLLLAQYATLSDDRNLISEIGELFIKSLIEHFDQNIIDLINYGFEYGLPLFSNSKLLMLFLYEFSQTDEPSKYLNTCLSISNILSTWPGLFAFGLEMQGLKNLILCLSNKQQPILEIFQNITNFQNKPNHITNSYFGFLLNYLIKIDFLPIISSTPFYHSIVPYLTNYIDLKLPSIDSISNTAQIQFEVSDHFYNTTDQLSTFDIKAYQLPNDPKQFDWQIIQLKLETFRPINEIEIKAMKPFYQSLLDFFSGPFLFSDVVSNEKIISESLIELFDYLIHEQWGISLLQNSESTKNAFSYVIQSLQQNVLINANSPIWPFFATISNLMSTQPGVSLLANFELLESLRKIGDCTKLEVAKRILSLIRFDPDGGWAIPVYVQFINSQSREITSLAIKELRRKIRNSVTTNEKLILMLLIPHIKRAHSQKDADKLNESLSVLMELIHTNEFCFKTVVNDIQMHKILSESNHFIYSYLLSDPVSYDLVNIEDEINWWIEKGNKEYLKVYDKAMKYSFTKNKEILIEIPSVIVENDLVIPPPHLFSQMSKCDKGFEILSSYLPKLISELPNLSVTKQRALFIAFANFGSIKGKPIELLTKLNVIEKIIAVALNSPSYLLKGSLIDSLSLFELTDSISQCLNDHGFETFLFGNQHSIVPKDYQMFFTKKSTFCDVIPVLPNSDHIANDIQNALIELMNPIKAQDAKGQFFTLYRENQNEITTTDHGIYVHQLMSTFSYPNDSRTFILGIFKQTPLYPSIDMKCDSKNTALIKARLFLLMRKTNIDSYILNQDIATYSLKEFTSFIKEMNQTSISLDVPEVFLNDDDFAQLTTIDKSQFYALNDDEQEKVRSDLLSLK